MKAKVRVTRIVAERASGEGRAIGHHLPRGVTRSLTYESARPRRKVAPCDEVHVCEMTPRAGDSEETPPVHTGGLRSPYVLFARCRAQPCHPRARAPSHVSCAAPSQYGPTLRGC